jgi:hypothetical protein
MLNKLRETIESIRGLQQKTKEELEKLIPSILDKVFKGGFREWIEVSYSDK